MSAGRLSGFRTVQDEPPLKLRFAKNPTDEEFVAMAKAGFAANGTQFMGHEAGRLLLNSIHRQADGSVTATLTPIPAVAGDHIRREEFAELFTV